ncbi:MAG: recombinase family protein, partial [Prevotella sp.]|nr:recombinase family protein [Prevotella sp.]
MIYGYLRVSSDEQDINSQKQGVVKFAADKGWEIDKYITDEGVSGGKDPNKRNLGPLLKLLNKDDIIIASEISRLGRDLYMVMDILHFCMEKGCIIHTVKDKFTLGNDIQSKVLAFAFGLSAEIERQMIQQRTKEGLRLRMKMGVLLGRPYESKDGFNVTKLADVKEKLIEQYNWGVPLRRLAENFGVNRGTISRALYEWGIDKSGGKFAVKARNEKRKQLKANREMKYKDEEFKIVLIPRDEMISLIEQDLTIPQIAERFTAYTY